MKKIFMTIVAVAAIAACSKTEVQYENSAEISFAPTTKNITKVASSSGFLGTNEQLGIWAYWNYKDGQVNGYTGSINETTNTYSLYTESYLNNALFAYRNGSSWGGWDPSGAGTEVNHPWPTNGALVFAGYTKPTTAQIEDFSVEYNGVVSNQMVFNNYTQSSDTENMYDLCWFGRTPSSYNYRAEETATPVEVTLSHALTWITFKVKAEDSATQWTIKKFTLNNIKTVGTGTCVGTTTVEGTTITPASATWVFENDAPQANVTIYEDGTGLSLTTTSQEIENVTAGTVVIPQDPTSVSITWTYPVQGSNSPVTEKKTINLPAISGGWVAGIHYTYDLTFKANEILVSPSYVGWATSDQSVTVE